MRLLIAIYIHTYIYVTVWGFSANGKSIFRIVARALMSRLFVRNNGIDALGV